jgi:DNA invertase Pin-like site-specific DNA recombinase
MKTNIVAYYRVSTSRQGKSGLGLEGQREAVQRYASGVGATIIAEYTEVESGKRSDRKELLRAIPHAKRSNAVLVVAKLDRLSRNVAFLSALMDSGIEFVCCDNPHANRLTIHILAAVAEQEAVAISERTKAALAAAKARGVLLGSARPGHWDGREEARKSGMAKASAEGVRMIVEAANAAYTDLYGLVMGLRGEGLTLRAIAERLNAMGHTTRRGKPWQATQVMLVLRRAEKVAA